MTNQEIFDTVVTALRKQGCKSISNDICFYRKNGNSNCDIKCAAGHLIPDDKYYPNMEHSSINDIFKIDLAELNFSDENIKLIVSLQNIHDYRPVVSWEASWNKLADGFGLKYSVA